MADETIEFEPWHVSPKTAEESFFEDVNILRHDGLAVAVAVHNGNITPEEVVKHANLIAAAPKLYEMTALLERCIEYDIRRSENDGDDEGANLKRLTLAQVRDVLAEARGERQKFDA